MKLTTYAPEGVESKTYLNPFRAIADYAFQLEMVRTAELLYPCPFRIGFELSLFGVTIAASL